MIKRIKNSLIRKINRFKSKDLNQLGWKYWGKVGKGKIYNGYNCVLFLKYLGGDKFPYFITLFDHEVDDYKVIDFKVYNFKELGFVLERTLGRKYKKGLWKVK